MGNVYCLNGTVALWHIKSLWYIQAINFSNYLIRVDLGSQSNNDGNSINSNSFRPEKFEWPRSHHHTIMLREKDIRANYLQDIFIGNSFLFCYHTWLVNVYYSKSISESLVGVILVKTIYIHVRVIDKVTLRS